MLLIKKTVPQEVNVDILIRSSGSLTKVDLKTIDDFRADLEEIEICHRWFFKQNIKCYKTDFGLSCIVPVEIVKSLFSTDIEMGNVDNVFKWKFIGQPKPPDEIAEYVREITISAPPELF